ncbi:helix-turn-helix domain-containing protein [Tahibacter aquaticus]|nr:helix-turn-helix transcriptional regulator [Tahibacter aquaticus]
MRKSPKAVFCARLKAARRGARMSQKDLGIAAGLDEFVASTRVNRYETGVHEPDMETAGRLAQALGVPLAYLFADDDRQARLLLAFAALSKGRQDAFLAEIERAADT